MLPPGTLSVSTLPVPAVIGLERSRSPSSTVIVTLSVPALMPLAPMTRPSASVTENEP